MEVSGVVFIGVIFVISLALLCYCCLKFCTSESKYVPSTKNTPILPAAPEPKTIENPSLALYPSKTLPKVPSRSQISRIPTVGIVPPPPAPGFTIDGAKSVNISSCLPKPPPISIGYPVQVLATETSQSHCPRGGSPATETNHKIPGFHISKNTATAPSVDTFTQPGINRVPYPTIASLHHTKIESLVPISKNYPPSGTSLNSPRSPPPSYAEAMAERRLQAARNLSNRLSHFQSYR